MKTTVKNLTLITLAILPLSGCLRSLHPLFTDETLVFESELLGKWSEDDSEEYWLFEKGDDEKEYEVTIFDPDADGPAVLSGHLVRIGEENDLYLDLYLEDLELEGGTWVAIHLLPVHTFMRVKQIRPTLQMAIVDLDTAEEILKQDPAPLKHEHVDDTPILTAGPEALQRFFTDHRDSEKLFEDFSDLKPVENPPAEDSEKATPKGKSKAPSDGKARERDN